MGFHLAAGEAIKLIAPTASSLSIGSGSGRCGASPIRQNWSVLYSQIRPPGPVRIGGAILVTILHAWKVTGPLPPALAAVLITGLRLAASYRRWSAPIAVP